MKGAINKVLRNVASQQGCNEFQKRLIKATYGQDNKEPKEKHVIFLLTVMHGSQADISPKEMIKTLVNRMLEQKAYFSINMKLLIIFHRILQDKLLSHKLVKASKKDSFALTPYKKEGSNSQNERIHSLMSTYYCEYLTTLMKFLKKTGFKSLTKDAGLAEVVLEKMSNSDLLSFLKRLQKLVEQIKLQLNNSDFCMRSRLTSSYLANIFMDYSKVYTMYYTAMELIKKRYESFGSQKKYQRIFEKYEYFLKFTSDFSSLSKTLPCKLNMKYEAPKIYDSNQDTYNKLKTKSDTRQPSKSTKIIPKGSWVEEDKSDESAKKYQSEKQIERFFSLRNSDLNSENFDDPKKQDSNRLDVCEQLDPLENLLNGVRLETRKQTLAPRKAAKPELILSGSNNSSVSNSSGEAIGTFRKFQTCMDLQNYPLH